ncbi:MAG: long-chain fatty acid--CoA ligase [Alphaproteobacteria bacterium]|nr:long-chain fatty acid--CoA ligase [Alphaproteobacteria bacterium]
MAARGTGVSDAAARPGRLGLADDLAARCSGVTFGDLLERHARMQPHAPAVQCDTTCLGYAALDARVNRLSRALATHGIARGDRVGILSENRVEYVEAMFAVAKLGAILANLNWRLRPEELLSAIGVTTPKLILVSPRYAAVLAGLAHGAETVLEFGRGYEALLERASAEAVPIRAEPEDGLVVIYTSGTTGVPKGALVSHRAEMARMQIAQISYGLTIADAALAWTPLFHVASVDPAYAALGIGGKLIVVDGFDLDRLLAIIERERLWWLVLIPGMLDRLIAALKERRIEPKGIKLVGAQADLLPRHQIAEVSGLLNARFWNTYGLSECGIPVASGNSFAPGELPARLSKTVDILCRYRLVDADDNDVPDGMPGELCFRGASLFSGYWNAAETNRHDFRNGHFHTGDVLKRNPDGTLDFVDRVKYMIKSGGENIYPAEIEAVLLADKRVDDVAVVKRRDPQWGEVPVAFVSRNDDSLDEAELMARCRERLAGYKRPKQIRFVALADFPRSTAGKIQRFIVEKWLEEPAGKGS